MAMLRWTVQFSVDESWVADGFDLTEERAKEMLNCDLRYAYGHEIGAKVLKAPAALRVGKLQGYKDGATVESNRRAGRL